MPTSNYLGNKLLDLILGATAYSIPATLYVALFTSTPTPATTGTEVTGGSYGRVAITNNSTNFPNASSKTKSNAIAIPFAPATAGWGTVTAVGLWDALTGGNLLIYAPLSTSRLVSSGDTPNFAIGQLVFNAT